MSVRKRIMLMFAAVLLLFVTLYAQGQCPPQRMVLYSHPTQLHTCWLSEKMYRLHLHLRVEQGKGLSSS